MAILCAYRTEITLAVVMIGLNCRCSKQENTVQNIVLGPPAILDGEYWYKLGEVDKDTISVLYACRSGQVGLHSELTIKKTDINGKNVWTSVIDNLSEEKWWIFPGSFSIGNTMFSLAINNRSQSEKDRLTTTYIAYAVDGDTQADYYMRLLNYLAKRLVAVGLIAILKTLIFSFRMPRIMAICFM